MDKLPKRKVTIDELLDKSSVKEVIDWALEDINEIEDIVVIYSKGESIHWWDNMSISRLNYLIDSVKTHILNNPQGE